MKSNSLYIVMMVMLALSLGGLFALAIYLGYRKGKANEEKLIEAMIEQSRAQSEAIKALQSRHAEVLEFMRKLQGGK